MANGSPQAEALQLYAFAFVIYTLAGGALFFFFGGGKDTLLKQLIGLPFLPAFLIWMVILGCLSIPYHWLYPEMHMTQLDFEGTEEEKRKLRDYRSECRQIGFFRRLAEKAGLVQKKRPAAPFTSELQDETP